MTHTVTSTFERYGFPFHYDRSVIPNDDDQSTLFMCSGMQRYKPRFSQRDKGRLSTLQSCVRTDDLDLVGDGTHLTYFEMVGNFSFGNGDYITSVEMWHDIIGDLGIPVTSVHVHPTQGFHRRHWQRMGSHVIDDPECVWSDGEIGGYCCELYVGDLEIGNLVNTLEHSTDVGFGWERLHQVVEGKSRVDETSLFTQTGDPVCNDHLRTLLSLKDNGVKPGNKGRDYVCRRLLRRVLTRPVDWTDWPVSEWLEVEQKRREEALKQGRRMLRRHGDKSDQFWWETFGVLPEERSML